MNTLICAGGSSLRVLKAVVNLCAVGLGPREIRVLVVDPDGSNGNGAELRQVMELYMRSRERLKDNLAADLPVFGTAFDLLEANDSRQGLKVWPVLDAREKLADVINYDNLSASATPPDVARLLFTEDELRMDLERGFMGHTSVGAAAMSLVALQADREPWRQLAEKIRQDVTQQSGSNVFIVGSVFGGTGASALHPLSRFIRTIPEANRERLRISASALVPYFSFNDSSGLRDAARSKMAAQAQWFSLRTKSAVQFYEHLRQNGDLSFDSTFWIGDKSPIDVRYSEGGPGQQNPAHFVDLLAALACLEFFADPSVQGNFYGAPRQNEHAELPDMNVVDWADLPFRRLTPESVRRRCLAFVLAAAMHVGFIDPLIHDSRLDAMPFCVPWYLRRFARKGDHFLRKVNRDDVAMLSAFFADHHLRWWSQINEPQNVLLFNRTTFDASAGDGRVSVFLDRLRNLVGPDRPGERTFDGVDTFLTEMEHVPRRRSGKAGAGALLSLLLHAADGYVDRVYHM